VTLLARLDNENQTLLDFHVLPNIERLRRFHIRPDDPWLHRGVCLDKLSDFCTIVVRVRAKKMEATG
jgi:hypothetical protein